MGACVQTPSHEAVSTVSDIDILSPGFSPDVLSGKSAKKEEKEKRQNFVFVHSKHYERYFNRQFKVSMCCAKGERRTMEDAHLCKFSFSDHPGFAVFGVFDGHHGAKASEYLAENLYDRLNELEDIEDSDRIVDVISEMDKEFLASEHGVAGSTVVLAIIGTDFDSDFDKRETDRGQNRKDSLKKESLRSRINIAKSTETKSNALFGKKGLLPGFEIKHNARIFWCGDSRAYLVKDFDMNSEKVPDFEALTTDHNTDNASEVRRVENEGGNIINGRVDGTLAVTRSFGDNAMKYEGSVISNHCEYTEFEVNAGDALLLCCDGLVEKWKDHTLIRKLKDNLHGSSQNKTDTAKRVGDLVDDAIYEGSKDNISAMFIEFKDGTKQAAHRSYADVGGNV